MRVIAESPISTRLRTDWLSDPRVLRIFSLVAVLSLWEIFGRQRPIFMSHPSAVANALFELTVLEARMWEIFGPTLRGLAVGFAIASTLGVAIGFVMGRSRLVSLILDPYVNALYATPRITLIPLLVLWVGIDFQLRVTVVTLSSIFPIIINTYNGARDVNRDWLDAGRIFLADNFQTLRTIVIPASLPYVFAGLRIGSLRALTGAIVAEMTAAVTGTGAVIFAFSRAFQTDRLFATLIVLGFLGIALGQGVHWLQNTATPWARTREVR